MDVGIAHTLRPRLQPRETVRVAWDVGGVAFSESASRGSQRDDVARVARHALALFGARTTSAALKCTSRDGRRSRYAFALFALALFGAVLLVAAAVVALLAFDGDADAPAKPRAAGRTAPAPS